jgi:hypothetical protein
VDQWQGRTACAVQHNKIRAVIVVHHCRHGRLTVFASRGSRTKKYVLIFSDIYVVVRRHSPPLSQ